ncbi:MAG: hypothetical protein KUG51_03745, partial [Urechidicola sp.]|nr:hypothetical protein [Urechidicola sp.]
SLKQKIVENGNKGFANQVAVQIKISQGVMNFHNDKKEQGLKMLEEAVEMEDIVGKHGVTPGKLIPAREFLGNAFLAMNEPNKALVVFEENLNVNPNRFNGLYGAAIAAKKSGDTKKAQMYFNNLLKLAENINSNRVELIEAREFVSQTT